MYSVTPRRAGPDVPAQMLLPSQQSMNVRFLPWPGREKGGRPLRCPAAGCFAPPRRGSGWRTRDPTAARSVGHRHVHANHERRRVLPAHSPHRAVPEAAHGGDVEVCLPLRRARDTRQGSGGVLDGEVTAHAFSCLCSPGETVNAFFGRPVLTGAFPRLGTMPGIHEPR